MARASSDDELEAQLLIALLSAFAVMDVCITMAEDERPAYRFCG